MSVQGVGSATDHPWVKPTQVVRAGPREIVKPVETVKVTGQDATRAYMDEALKKKMGIGQNLNVVT
ncbi:MAG: hypothetical protein Q7S16_05230 [bacterium]|nr:hypothetical protein [bacterium]